MEHVSISQAITICVPETSMSTTVHTYMLFFSGTYMGTNINCVTRSTVHNVCRLHFVINIYH